MEQPDGVDPYAERVAARIDRLPATRHIWWLVALVSFGAFFEIYDILLSAPLSVALVAEGIFRTGRAGQFGFSDQALFLAATFGGLYIGTLAFSVAADRLGRRLVFTVALLWYAIATAIMGMQHTALAIDLWRFVASVGIGLELVTIDCYLTELVPAHAQGRAFALSAGIQFLSSPVVAILAWLLIPGRHFGIDGWRWLTFVPAIGAILIWWVRRTLPESPRWLAVRGRHAEAEIVLADIERHVSADLGHDVPPPRQSPRSTSAAPTGPAPRLFDAAHRRGTIVLIIFHLFQAMGYFGFSNWLPTLLVSQGITISKSLGYTAIIAIIPPASSFLFMLFADRLDRKWLVVGGAVVAAGFGLLLARTTPSSTFLDYALAGSGTAVGLSLMSFAYHSYQSTIFPTEIRARGVGVVYSFSRFSTIASGYLIAFVLQSFGSGAVFLLIAGAMIVVALVIGLFGPDTRATLRHVDQNARFTS